MRLADMDGCGGSIKKPTVEGTISGCLWTGN